ncbi:hypothetical protein [Acidocella sp.]|jgi:hypothetical protein|uniref:hypothetical protein n=1 Tax=Acidocella sp. TaxID=50710 RepID=UPI002F42D626
MPKITARDDELSTRPKIREKLVTLFAEVDKGFTDQQQRADDNLDFWDIYNCVLGARQFYNGNSKLFLPIVRNAIKARRTRFINQMFPPIGRYVDVVAEDADNVNAIIALMEHYVTETKLRTEIMPALMANGDVEGQYTIYVDWGKTERHVVSRETKPVEVDGLEQPDFGEVEEITEETIPDDGPTVEVISDNDFLVLPVTVDSLERALARGGSVTVRRRWSKAEIRRMIDDGDFTEDAGETVLESMSRKDGPGSANTAKKQAETAGIKTSESGKYCLGYEVWTRLKVDGKQRLCRAYYGGDDVVLGCKLNPFWCDRQPILSAPVEKVAGLFKGMSLISPGVMDMQIWANDTANEAADQGHFAMLPIVMTDPEQNPRYASMVLDLAAVWEANPRSTEFVKFPDTTQQALEKIAAATQMINQSLAVTSTMIPSQGQKSKQNQAMVAQEQQVDLLNTSDAVTVIEGGILTPLVQRFAEYDHQFRDDDILIRSFGEMGMNVIMEQVPPIQMNRRWQLRWFGIEAQRNAQQIQQQISFMNVLNGIPPEKLEGLQLHMAPLLMHAALNIFGPRLAGRILTDLKHQLATDPRRENDLLSQGFDVLTHPLDDDQKHIETHMELPQGPQRDAHIQMHLRAVQMKAIANMPKGNPGVPGGAGPGVAGTPKPGGQVAPPRQGKQPPGRIAPDQMVRAGAPAMPRKM